MRKFTLLMAGLFAGIFVSNAQTVSTFDTLPLTGSDTFYVNYSSFGNDVGFHDGLAHFPCVYDTSWGYTFLSSGFVYSNHTDSATSGFMNQYSAKTAMGYNSAQYVVGFGADNYVALRGAAIGKPVSGFAVTNSTFAYNAMRDGDAFTKKFGGVTGNDEDWFKLVIRGYLNDTETHAVEVYLADFRPINSTNDKILNTWKWVNLLPLGNVDSLSFHLSSTDTGQFGMNTPAYFCMDDFTTAENLSVNSAPKTVAAKIYPNPAVNELFVQLQDADVKKIQVYDMSGRVIATYEVKDNLTSINTSGFVAGTYVLQLVGDEKTASVRFVKQ